MMPQFNDAYVNNSTNEVTKYSDKISSAILSNGNQKLFWNKLTINKSSLIRYMHVQTWV